MGALALLKLTAQEEDTKSSELSRQKRDTKFAPIMKDIRTIIKFLMKLYPNNIKELGLYGITIVLTPKVEKIRNRVIKASTSALKVRVNIGSTIVNTGTIPLYIYKGATISGTPTTLGVGDIYKITKGNSIVSINNPLTTASGKVALIPAKKSV